MNTSVSTLTENDDLSYLREKKPFTIPSISQQLREREREREMEKKLTALIHLFVTDFLSCFANYIVAPAITDVTMFAVCPGTDECSLAIYLSGIQQAIKGLGTAFMTPLIGNLSDHYGRKALLTLPMTLSVIPVAVLACSRTTNYFYAYYAISTLTSIVGDKSISCLTHTYLADNVSDGQRASAFGIISGIKSGAYVCATLAARFLSTGSTFQVATFVSLLAVVYMRIFLEESVPDQVDSMTQPILKEGEESVPDQVDSMTQPILKEGEDVIQKDSNAHRKKPVSKKIAFLEDIICFLKSSPLFYQAALISFFRSLADDGMTSSSNYYLKARFHFNKNQFAEIRLISGIATTISQLFLMPLLVSPLGDGRLLSIGLLVSCIDTILHSIAWSAWVPYAATALSILTIFAPPAIFSIVSKQAVAREQGKAQGCLSSVNSLANLIAPLIFSPLTALFLSEDAPFHFPGFSIMCIAIIFIIAYIQSLRIESAPSTSSDKNSSNCTEV